MRWRCTSPKSIRYDRYGGRGIRVCEQWDDIHNFIRDMGPRPSPLHTIERIDNDGNYEPGNCRWATRLEQSANTCATNRVVLGSKTVSMNQAWKLLGLKSAGLLYNKMRWEGLSAQQAVDYYAGCKRNGIMTPDELRAAANTLYGSRSAQKKLAYALGSDVASVRRWWSGRTPIPGPVQVAVTLMLERAAP